MHSLVCFVRTEDGCTYVLLHLSSAQRAWPARSLLVLQRLRCSVPLLMPSLNRTRSALHGKAASERSEASTPHTSAVVGEDDVLVLWCVGQHAWWKERGATKCGRGSGWLVHVEKRVCARRPIAYENEKRELKRKACMSRRRHDILALYLACLLVVFLRCCIRKKKYGWNIGQRSKKNTSKTKGRCTVW